MAGSFFDWYLKERRREVRAWAHDHPGRQPNYCATWSLRPATLVDPDAPGPQFGDIPLDLGRLYLPGWTCPARTSSWPVASPTLVGWTCPPAPSCSPGASSPPR